MSARIRLLVLLQAGAIAAATAALLLAIGMPFAVAHAVDGRRFAALVGAGAVGTFGVTAAILARSFGAPLRRLLAAARRIGEAAELPPLGLPGEEGAAGLSRAALAFERTAAALVAERARVAAQVVELERANLDLAVAREELVRSERLAAVGRLAAGVAHEVGNPLGAIGGFAEIARARLEAGAPAADVADLLVRIGAETRRIDAIVRDLLDFARPAPPALVPVSVGAALDGALRLAEVQPRFRSVEVSVALPPDLPPVRADPRRLAQVLLNVLLNAGDAMGGAGEVRVTARRDGTAVEIAVADRGPGIAPADLQRIFDPFFTTKPPGQGTGLGLAVCHGILEALGGSITAEAGDGGAVFRIRLPAAEAARGGTSGPAAGAC
ncbi:sensor histidine kinase [Anaeromyxobacter oryzae]|uniref:histidine kinase n=1 Tax=Anaeromyxobacter oryzae TaxID=2918170 RepID=A0ABM7WXP3_9BACT|nr:ATP-binding protein [Anaeromyxobacter oryzae]BDG04294.1 hypothetical protein AMOR_32900 [Anaeromyxobacter oryzae]